MSIFIVVIFGLILSYSVGGFMALICVSGMKDTVWKYILGVLIALAIGFGLMGAMALEARNDQNKYNDGKCNSCGEQFVLFDVEHIKNSGDIYYYQCSNGHVIETHSLFS